MKNYFLTSAIACGLFASLTASAAAEFFYQTPENQQIAQPELVYKTISAKMENDVKLSQKTTELNVRFERGLTANLSVAALLSYTNMSVDLTGPGGSQTIDSKGMQNIGLQAKSFTTLSDTQTFWYGITLSLSPGNFTSKEKNANLTETNAITGGHEIKPYLGFSLLVETMTFGAKIETELNLVDQTQDKTDVNGVETRTKASGGELTRLTAFLEKPVTQGTLGALLSYGSSSTAKYKTGSSTRSTPGSNDIILSVYDTYTWSETITLVGSIAYSKLVSDKFIGMKVSSSSEFDFQFGGRYSF